MTAYSPILRPKSSKPSSPTSVVAADTRTCLCEREIVCVLVLVCVRVCVRVCVCEQRRIKNGGEREDRIANSRQGNMRKKLKKKEDNKKKCHLSLKPPPLPSLTSSSATKVAGFEVLHLLHAARQHQFTLPHPVQFCIEIGGVLIT